MRASAMLGPGTTEDRYRPLVGVIIPPPRSYGIHTSLQDRPASFDKLRMRENLGGTKKDPHPELVEGRTSPIPFSSKPLMRLAYLFECPSPRSGGGWVGVAGTTALHRVVERPPP